MPKIATRYVNAGIRFRIYLWFPAAASRCIFRFIGTIIIYCGIRASNAKNRPHAALRVSASIRRIWIIYWQTFIALMNIIRITVRRREMPMRWIFNDVNACRMLVISTRADYCYIPSRPGIARDVTGISTRRDAECGISSIPLPSLSSRAQYPSRHSRTSSVIIYCLTVDARALTTARKIFSSLMIANGFPSRSHGASICAHELSAPAWQLKRYRDTTT